MTTASPTIINGGFVTLSGIDDNWSYDDYFDANTAPVFNENGIMIKSVKFAPGATNDILILKEGSNTGPIISQITCDSLKTEYDVHFEDFHYKPFLDFDASTISTGGIVIINYSWN